MTSLRILKLAVVGVMAASIVGCSCVKKEELDAVRAEAATAKRTADEALTTAKAAELHANAAAAQSKAAEDRAGRAEEAVNRSFKKSMRK
ncbi:MAG: alanine-zipper protein [Bdellovibrionota bacterium]